MSDSDRPPPSVPLPASHPIGEVQYEHYRVLRQATGALWELGRGAMGVTYKAIDVNLHSFVALKVVNALFLDEETARERFKREARAAASLRHRNVASVYHLGHDNQNYFYAMEFIEGETLEHRLKRRGSLSPTTALPILRQVASALMAAHEKGLVHRDIKPSNIMLQDEVDETDMVKLIDFGLAKSVVEGGGSLVHVNTTGFLGTPLFASPEQCDELAPDIRSDIYSLGVTLWFMLTNRPPFTGSLAQVFAQHLQKKPPFEQLPSDVPQCLRTLLARMLAKERTDRPQTPGELRQEIDRCISMLDQPVSDSPSMVEPAREGTLLDGRWELLSKVGQTPEGTLFQARELSTDQKVSILVLAAEQKSLSPARLYEARQLLARFRAAPHPGFWSIADLIESEGRHFFVGENLQGYVLLDLLRRRGRLSGSDTLLLGGPLAVALDHAAARKLGGAGIDPVHLFLHFPRGIPAELLDEPVTKWGTFVTKIDPTTAIVPQEVFLEQTWDGSRTLIPDANKSPEPVVRQLAALFYELLDGAPPPDQLDPYTPLSNLNEPGNRLLRQALHEPQTFPTATAFWKQLHQTMGSGIKASRDAPRPIGKGKAAPDSPVRSGGIPRPLVWMMALSVVASVATFVTVAYLLTRPQKEENTPATASLGQVAETQQFPIAPVPVAATSPVPTPVVSASSAQNRGAGAVLVQKVDYLGQTSEMIVKVQAPLLRIDFGSETSTIVNSESGELILLMHGTKTYLSKSGEEARKMLEQTMGKSAAGTESSPPRATGKTETLRTPEREFKAELYTFGTADVRGTYWMVKDYPNGPEILTIIGKIGEPARSLLFSGLNTMDKLAGFPIKVETEAANGNRVTSTMVASRIADLPAADFSLPPDYKRIDL